MSEIIFVGLYEVREIPKGWQHPKDARGEYVPLLPFGYAFDEGETGETMPPPLGDVEIAAYEAVTEGTPIAPAFPDTPQGRLALCNWCAEQERVVGGLKADGEAWAAILFGGAEITADGIVVAQDR